MRGAEIEASRGEWYGDGVSPSLADYRGAS